MKNMKKIVSMLLALCLVLSMGTVAFAASGNVNDTKGSITIDNAHVGATYSIYQILVLESFDTSAPAFTYSASAAWKTWVEDQNGGGKYLTTLSNGSVEWKPGSSVADFAADAIAYAKSANITATDTETATSTNPDAKNVELKFDNLKLGYYLVDSSAGTLCSIDSTVPNIHIEDKNLIPLVDKKVFDESGNPQESISAKIGQTITFGTKITVYEGSHNVVYQDKMESGLTYSGDDKVKVYYTPKSQGNEVAAENYEVVSTGLADGITFEVRFTDTFMATITKATELTIVYEAVLNEKAEIYDGTNLNEGRLKYGDDGETKWDPAEVITYKFGIVKTDVTNKILTGAKFELYYDEECKNQILLVEDAPEGITPENDVNYYRPATPEEIAETGFKSAVIEVGKACIWGIRDNVAMYLKEIEAPAGYNRLEEPYHIHALQGENNLPSFTAEGLYEKGGVEVENLTGTQLPQTGGIGTTLFYVFGGLLAAGAVILLVTKKRMSV